MTAAGAEAGPPAPGAPGPPASPPAPARPPDGRSYYGRPILKEPVWHWYIPAYFFCGGLAGASSLLATVAAWSGAPRLAQRARLTALTALTVSAGLLVKDLGRPSRFYNMLRVAKPTSPMSVGSWLLAGYGPAAGAAALGRSLPVVGPVLTPVADAAAAMLGAGVATYTAVLIGDTAVPAWHGAHRQLPFLFASGAAASAGAIAAVMAPAAEAGPARRLAVGGAVAELVAERLVERQLGAVAEVFHHGPVGRLSQAAQGCSVLGAVLLGAFGRRRPAAVAGGVLVAAGAALTRFSVFEAGKASVRDPRYTVVPQRERQSGS